MRKIIYTLSLLIGLSLGCTSTQMLEPISPFEATRAALISTATAYAVVPSQIANQAATVRIDSSADPFSLTATSIIATGTAQATQQNRCWQRGIVTQFYYGADGNYEAPQIADVERDFYSCEANLPYSYEILIDNNLDFVPEARLIQVLEDAVSRLPDYPPFNAEPSSEILVISYLQRGTMDYTSFTYSEALAAYEAGLRGVELAATLGIQNTDMTATAVLATAAAWELTHEAEYGLELTSYFLRDASATAYANSIPTLNAAQGQMIAQTQVPLAATENAYAALYNENRIQAYADMTAIAQGTDVYSLTTTAIIANASPNAEELETQNAAFDLTATSIIATATAQSFLTASSNIATAQNFVTPTPCQNYAWQNITLAYSPLGIENWQQNPSILNSHQIFCLTNIGFLPSHEIRIEIGGGLKTEDFYLILEDALSRLAGYPPNRPEISEMIRIEQIDKGYYSYGVFSYSDALAAYEAGLRGADLAEALGIYFP